jgi:hypothetical protein
MVDLRPLRSSSFRHLAGATWINEFGNWVGEIALAILVYDRTGSPLATAALFLALRFLPSALAPLLAVRLETSSPRVVLASMYMLEAALFVALIAVARHFSLALLLVLAGCDGVLAITSSALSRSAVATTLTKDGLMREGNALLNLGGMIVIAGGPAISGLLVASRGVVSALELDAGTFVIAAAIIATAKGLQIASDEDASFRERVASGLKLLRTRPTVTRLLVATTLVVGLGSIVVPVEVVFAKHTLHAGDSGYGLLLTAWGIGMVVGSFTFASMKNLRLMVVLGVGTTLIVAGYCGLAVAPSLAVACGFSWLGGTGNSAAWVAARIALQERIPLNRQPGLMAVLEAANQLMPAIGFIVGGAITALSSPRAAYAISAAGVAVVLLWFTVRPIDRVPLSEITAVDEPRSDSACQPKTQEKEVSSRTNYSANTNLG